MDFTIFPFKGVERISFGATREDVRAAIGHDPKSFLKDPRDTYPADFFSAEGATFYYDSEGFLEAVEFSTPAQPTVNSIGLLGLSFKEAVETLSRQDAQVETEVDGAISYGLGVSIHAPLAKDDPFAPVESVLAFRTGYFN